MPTPDIFVAQGDTDAPPSSELGPVGAGERGNAAPATVSEIRALLKEAMQSQHVELQRLFGEMRHELKPRLAPQGLEPRALHLVAGAEPPCPVKMCEEIDTMAERFVDGDPLHSNDGDMTMADPQWTSKESAELDIKPDAIPRVSSKTASEAIRRSSSSHNFVSKRALRRAIDTSGPFTRFVQGGLFDNICGGLICVNAIAIGVHANIRAQDPGMCDPTWSHIFLAFNLMFLVELSLRLFVFKKAFFCGPDLRWNMFDVLIVGAGLFEDVMSFTMGDGNCDADSSISQNRSDSLVSGITILRILRIVRVLRVVKAFRSMALFRDLRIMVQSTLHCMMPLVWACVLLGFIHWCFSVYFIHLAADQIKYRLLLQGPSALEQEDVKEVLAWFGGLSTSMYTLFQSITGGVNWEGPAAALYKISGQVHCTLVYMVFIALTMFSVLNVITGIFVENAIRCARKDRDFSIHVALKNKEAFVNDVYQVFAEADIDASGHLTLAEFMEHVDDPRVQAFLECLELDAISSQRMFHLLDTDNSGSLSLDEFIDGCTNMKGQAQHFDVALLSADMQKWFRSTSESIMRVERLVVPNSRGGGLTSTV